MIGWLETSDSATISIGTVTVAPGPTSEAGAVRRTIVSVGPSGPSGLIAAPCSRTSPVNGSDPGSKKPAGIGVAAKSTWLPAPGGVVNRSMVGWIEAQTVGVPVQAPPVHTSGVVQAFRSLHACPSGAFGLEQRPDPGLQVPAAWHWSEAVQTTGFDPTQVPAWQVSGPVHRLLSVQPVPFAAVAQVLSEQTVTSLTAGVAPAVVEARVALYFR